MGTITEIILIYLFLDWLFSKLKLDHKIEELKNRVPGKRFSLFLHRLGACEGCKTFWFYAIPTYAINEAFELTPHPEAKYIFCIVGAWWLKKNIEAWSR